MEPGGRRRGARGAALASRIGAAFAPLLASACGAVLGLEEWDVEPGGEGGSAAVSSSGADGGGPSTTGSTSTSSAGGEVGDGGGGAGGGGSTASTGGGGAGGGCGVPDTSEHCGACERSCWGGACVDGVCAPALVAPETTGASGLLAVHGDHIAWIDGASQLRVATKSQTAAPTTVGVAPDALSLALGDLGAGGVAAFHSTSSQVWRHRLDGSDPLPLLDVAGMQAQYELTPYPQGVVMAGGFVLWFEQNTSTNGGVWSSAPTMTSVASRQCAGSGVQELSVGGAVVYYVRRDALNDLVLFQCQGGAPSQLLLTEPELYPHEIAGDASGLVYFSTLATGDAQAPYSIRRVSGQGASELVVPLPNAAGATRGLSHGAGSLFWIGHNNRTLLTTPKQPGGALASIVRDGVDVIGVQGVAADEQGVYWADASGVWALRRDGP